MNAPVDLHFSPIADVRQPYVGAEANRILWDVVRDCFAGKQEVRAELRTLKLSARATFRAPWATMTMPRSPQVATLYQSKHFPPATAMLAGTCRHLFEFQPDFASISLYADGDDYLGWHTDYDSYVGPAGGHSPVATFSFGAEREVSFARIGSDEVVHTLRPAHGSAYLMDPRCQRYFQHAVLKTEDPVGARVAVTFFCGQRDDRRRIWWTLVDTESELPIVCAPPLEAYKAMIGRENTTTMVTPDGQSDSYSLEEGLTQLGVFDDAAKAEIAELRAAKMKPAPSSCDYGPMPKPPQPTMPRLPDSMLDDEMIDQMMDDPVAIAMAKSMLARMRCALCKQPSTPVKLTVDAQVMVIERCSDSGMVGGVVLDSGVVDLCLSCVQKALGRPIRPSELAASPINRNLLQAFVLGCDHNLLEERRTEASNRISEIESVFGPTSSS